MRAKPGLVFVTAFAFSLGACSSRPRHFVATLDPPAVDEKTFARDMNICRVLVGRGYKSEFLAQAAAASTGTLAASGTLMASFSAGGFFAPATATSSTLAVAVLPVGIFMGFGVTRAIRSGREKRLKISLSDCLAEHGYKVAGWTPTKLPKNLKPVKNAAPVKSEPEQAPPPTP